MKSEDNHGSGPRSRVILYLEDDDAAAYLFEREAREINPSVLVHRVLDCASAIAFLRQEQPFTGVARPDVIVLDLNLGGDSGFTVLRAIRGDPAFAQLPVIIFTSSEAACDRVEAQRSRADAYLVKSVELSAFTSAAALALRLAA